MAFVTRTRSIAVALAAALGVAAALTPQAASAKPIARAGWLRGVEVTEYYPAPEWWFIGKKVATPGLNRLSRIDWLYSATGLSMEGDGVGLDGRMYHIDSIGDAGWVTASGRSSDPGKHGWKGGAPFLRAGGYWQNKAKAVTFPLDGGGWSNGAGKRYRPLDDVTFAAGNSKPLKYYRSIAVDPRLIPLGSKVYIAAYRTSAGGGWFSADDTGGAIVGRHVDVYRTPPASSAIGGNLLEDQRVYVQPPGAKPASGAPAPSTVKPTPTPSVPIPQPPAQLTPPRSGGASAP